MRQVSRVLSTYAADVSGVCSALYEMGGMVIMHDASGCNSTYTTHDEPRWYDMPSLVFISGLSELEAVMGDEERLMKDVGQAARELKPRFVAIAGSPIPMMMGTDFRGVARILERRLGIPVMGFSTNGTRSYISGAGMALAEAARRFCRDGSRLEAPLGSYEGRISVNLLGVTPLDFSTVGNVEALRETFLSAGFSVSSCWAMGSSWEELIGAGRARVNVAVSAAGIQLAKTLREQFGTPWVLGIPVGRELTRTMAEAVERAARTGENQLPVHLSAADEEGKGIYVVGEWVWAMSVRFSLIRDYGCRRVKVICPLESGDLFEDRLLSGGKELAAGVREAAERESMFLEYEDQIEEQLKDAALVIADPLYRRILPRDRQADFLDFPHEGYSGRIYRKEIPVFIGEGWNRWLESQRAFERL